MEKSHLRICHGSRLILVGNFLDTMSHLITSKIPTIWNKLVKLQLFVSTYSCAIAVQTLGVIFVSRCRSTKLTIDYFWHLKSCVFYFLWWSVCRGDIAEFFRSENRKKYLFVLQTISSLLLTCWLKPPPEGIDIHRPH